MNLNHWDCRILHSIDDLQKFVDLEIAVWDLEPRDAVPTSLLHVMAMNGSLVVGAYDQSEFVGMAFAFPVPHGKQWMLWSHMAGVRSDYQGKGIGFALKQFQRVWALEHGYKTIAWTFDPLQRGNANFNLHLLGATASIYHVNLYGEMTDGINAGLPSDRLEVHWDLRHKRVQKLAKNISIQSKLSNEYFGQFLLKADTENSICFNKSILESTSHYLIEIPANLADVKQKSPEQALAWRMALREAFESAFAQGYTAEDFIKLDGRYCYVLAPMPPWFLYVLECSDGSLYTGITLDLNRRLKEHNAGRGAAYTASHLPVNPIGAWRFNSQGEALKAEASFKRYPRQKKLNMIKQASIYRDAPFIPVQSP